MSQVTELITDKRTLDRIHTFMESLRLDGWLLIPRVGPEAVVISNSFGLDQAITTLEEAKAFVANQSPAP